MRYLYTVVVLLLALTLGTPASEAVPPERIVDSDATGMLSVQVTARVAGVGTLKSTSVGAGTIRVASATPGEFFTRLSLPYVGFGGSGLNRTIKLGRESFDVTDTGVVGAFVLTTLRDNRLTVRDQLLSLQALPFFGSQSDASLIEVLLGSALSTNGSGLPQHEVLEILGQQLDITTVRVSGSLRAKPGNTAYKASFVVSFRGTMASGPHEGERISGRAVIKFTSTAEPQENPLPDVQ